MIKWRLKGSGWGSRDRKLFIPHFVLIVVNFSPLVITQTVNLYKRTPLTVFGNEYFPCYLIFFWTIFGVLFDGDSNFFSQTYQTKWWA